MSDNQLTCTSTHCERRQECASPHDCTGSAKRRQTPCEHCGAGDTRGVSSEDHWVVTICGGCKAYVGTFFDDEGARP